MQGSRCINNNQNKFGYLNVVARIYDQGRAEVYERLGIPTVATVRWAADQVLRSLMPEGSEPAWRDPSGQVRLIRVNTHTDWVGMKISAIQERIHTPLPFLLRFGQGMVPDGATLLQDGDVVYAAVEVERITEIEGLLAKPPVKR